MPVSDDVGVSTPSLMALLLPVTDRACGEHGERYGDPCFVCFWSAEHRIFAQWAARICYHYGVGDLAEDVLAQAAEHLYRRWRQAPPIDNPRGYLRRTLERQACDAYRGRGPARGRSRRPDLPLDQIEETLAGGASPERLAEQGDLSRLLRAAMDQLTDEQQEVVTCRLLLELSTEETAQHLRSTRAAVSSALHRAMTALRKLLPPTLLADYDDRGDQR